MGVVVCVMGSGLVVLGGVGMMSLKGFSTAPDAGAFSFFLSAPSPSVRDRAPILKMELRGVKKKVI